MAKKEEQTTHTSIDDLNEQLTGLEVKVQNNTKKIMWGIVAVLAVVCLILIWVYAVRRPGIQAADNAIGQADMSLALGNDSLALRQYTAVADDYGYDAGNRAALNAAIILYNNKQYEAAIDYLKKYSPTETLIGASSQSLMGDCYVNLKQYDEAVKCFREAAEISDNNPHYTPYFLMKEATVQRELKNYKAEADLYRQIEEKYPAFAAETGIETAKYLQRAELSAQQATEGVSAE